MKLDFFSCVLVVLILIILGSFFIPIVYSERFQTTIKVYKDDRLMTEASTICVSAKDFCKEYKLNLARTIYVSGNTSYYCDFNNNLYNVNTKTGASIKQENFSCEYILTKRKPFLWDN